MGLRRSCWAKISLVAIAVSPYTAEAAIACAAGGVASRHFRRSLGHFLDPVPCTTIEETIAELEDLALGRHSATVHWESRTRAQRSNRGGHHFREVPWLPEAKLKAIDAKAVWASDMLSLANVTIAFVVGPPDRAVRLLLQENRGKPSKFARAVKERHRGALSPVDIDSVKRLTSLQSTLGNRSDATAVLTSAYGRVGSDLFNLEKLLDSFTMAACAAPGNQAFGRARYVAVDWASSASTETLQAVLGDATFDGKPAELTRYWGTDPGHEQALGESPSYSEAHQTLMETYRRYSRKLAALGAVTDFADAETKDRVCGLLAEAGR